MEYKNIAELNPDIFTKIYALNPDLKIFTLVNAATLDLIYKNKFSNRLCAPCCFSGSIEDIAGVINALFSEKWNALFDSVQNMNVSAQNGGEHTTEKETTTTTPETTTEITGQVSPYDSGDFANNDKTTTTNTGKTDVVRNREYNRTTPNNANSVLSYLQKNPLYDTMFIDVNSVLTLNIF